MHCFIHCMCSNFMKTIRHHLTITANSDMLITVMTVTVIVLQFTYENF